MLSQHLCLKLKALQGSSQELGMKSKINTLLFGGQKVHSGFCWENPNILSSQPHISQYRGYVQEVTHLLSCISHHARQHRHFTIEKEQRGQVTARGHTARWAPAAESEGRPEWAGALTLGRFLWAD